MKKRILTNIILCFILLPILFSIIVYWKFKITQNHDFFSGSLASYYRISWPFIFIHFPVIFLIFVVFPYNLLVVKKQSRLNTIYKKALLFFFIEVFWTIVLSTVMNYFWTAGLSGMIAFLKWYLILSLLFVIPLHYLVDKKMKSDKTDENS